MHCSQPQRGRTHAGGSEIKTALRKVTKSKAQNEMQSAKPDETVPAPKPRSGPNPAPSPVPAPGCRRDQGSSGCGHNQPAASPPAAPNAPKPLGCTVGTAPMRICCTRGAGAVQQLRVSGKAAGSLGTCGERRERGAKRPGKRLSLELMTAELPSLGAPSPRLLIPPEPAAPAEEALRDGAHREGWGGGKNPPGVGGRWAARLRSRRVGTARCARVYLAPQPQ